MSESRGTFEPELLVATEDHSFGSAVVDAVEKTEDAASAERVEPATDSLTQRDFSGVDGAIVDDHISEPVVVIERFPEKADLPVVVLSGSAGDDDTVAQVIHGTYTGCQTHHPPALQRAESLEQLCLRSLNQPTG